MERRKLGTFLGVYTPTILTILGVIMYLRFGWLVGHLGLFRALLVVLLAHAITFTTTLSFSSVATNARVGVGGAYFIISRSLGLELGGAIGVPLFLAQAFSVTLYSYGLAESLRIVWPSLPVMPATLLIVLAVGLMAVSGAERALRSQALLMVLVGISLIALAVGAISNSASAPITLQPPSGSVGFFVGLAVFFPAVTGVMAGLGLSGDLRDPGRSIPVGSILAVLTGFVIYLIIPVLLAVGAKPEDLRQDPMIWSRVAIWGPWLVLPGLWAAIFSSAVGVILAAPRTLQALAKDGIAPRFLWRPTGDWRETMPGLVVSLVIAMAAVFFGDLNAVATVVSMFFLTVYGTLNVVAAFEALSGDPSWRPRIRVAWPVNLMGGLACVLVMVLINPIAGIVAFVAEFSLWLILSRRAQKARWGDARRGLYENLIRWALIHLARRPLSARNWRPHILIFVAEPLRELDLVRFGNWLSQERGVVTVCHLIVGDLMRNELDLPKKRGEMQQVLDSEGLVVFAEVDVVKDIVEGIVDVSQANGMAGLTSNTILLGWPSDPALQCEFLRVMRKLECLNKSLVVGRINPKYVFQREKRTIHVWWGGLERNSDLMLLLAYLLTRSPDWRGTRVKVMSIASSEVARTRTEVYLQRLIPDIRIEAEPHVILKPKDLSIAQLIQRESADAEVVFLGLATPTRGEEQSYAERLEKLAGDLPVVFFVKNASMFVGELLESPEEEFDAEEEPAAEEEKLKPSRAPRAD
ncbi:MAG: Na-K-Cl cotransporter [Candidatus Krumholzibacteria bacterium]|nr:Na-K-Cl cotransporter [Candidatus Krumholzibacteria bacterium]